MSGVPFTFATQSGNVAASELDANFAALLLASGWPSNIVLGTAAGSGNIVGITPSQLYAMLKGSLPFEVSGFMGGIQASGAWQILRYQSGVSNVILNQGNCIASCGTVTTAVAVFMIFDGGTQIGTLTFNPGSLVGTVALTTTPYTLNQGNILTVIAPVTPDTTLSDVSVTLGGTRG